MAEQNYFNDVPNLGDTGLTGKIGGSPYLDNLISMQVGAGTKLMRVDQSGLWLGAQKFADAPFSVDMNGNLISTSATISGNISALSGAIGGFTINSSYLAAGSAGNTVGLSPGDYPFWAGATYANRSSAPFRVTPAGALYASSVEVSGKVTSGANSTYSGNQIDKQYIGDLTADKITSGTFTVGGTNQPTAITIQESSLTGNARLGWQHGSRMWEDSSSRLGINSIGSPMSVYVNSYLRITIPSSGQTTIAGGVSTDGNLNVSGDSQIDGYVHTNSDRIQFNSNATPIYFRLADTHLASYHDTGGGHDRYIFDWAGGATFGIDKTGGWFHINGSDKEAIVLTSKGYRALYCAEAPEVWFFDFIKNKEIIDPLFLETTEGEMKFIKTEDGEFQVWRRRKGHAQKRFELKTAEEFERNEKFLQMAKVVN